ncbi:TetR/AcrR family transcriptional regulator [Streptomyces akebiae]|uniref:TetR/AcrR family transcriptional regulator n=1 Tax=Streptomyces akebiae TaxID=2865673 RepID=A0ABX8XV76_9ACTN|nr:TetR/AcrR family transcriptional regulator [Streptomyces akebiae]QYX79413.1 TetR/AcrR family transcriptional regulator [Streptomyces akebiae]
MSTPEGLTRKGLATRARIVEAAAELVLARGVNATTLEDVRAATRTSRSQLFHYFPEGKPDLVSALAGWQAARLLDAQRPSLEELDSWEAWQKWREAITAYYRAQPYWGCPIGSMVNELAGGHDQVAAAAQEAMADWQRLLQTGTERMITAGLLRADTDPQRLARSILAILQGGLLMTKTTRSEEPLLDALDTIFLTLRAHAVEPPR